MRTIVDWAEKHRPRTLADIVGNRVAVDQLRAWAEAWKAGPPEQRGVILAGPPGTGKTSAAHALARDMGWPVVELNASDQRNYDAVRRVATQGALHRGFDASGAFAPAGRTLVILDEADNLFGQEDRGGMKAIQETLRLAQNPVILIANDYYELTRRGGALKELALTLKFTRVRATSMLPALRRVATAEGLEPELGALEAVAERAGGDLRSAVNDLEAVAIGRTRVTVADVEAMGRRDVRGDIWTALGTIFYGSDADEARKSTWNLDEDPEHVSLWIDENLPILYQDRADLVEGYDRLSRADVFLGRAKRRQQFHLWSYAGELMTAGVATAKRTRPVGGRFVFPSWLSKQSRTRGLRESRDRLSRALYRGHDPLMHVSLKVAREEMLPLVRTIMDKDEEFAAMIAHRLRLDKDDVAWLLNDKASSKRVKLILDRADAMGPRPEPPSPFGGVEDADAAEEAEDEAALPPEDEEEAPTRTPAKKGAKAAPAKADKPGKAEKGKGRKTLFEF
ncbi:MAG TPA: replication factor C large subunit [Candidatus Thermoplasmatota archaeon]|nr:replication factor C large subunit [Candidatus Thermoplasmatota archaeon]